MTERRKTESTGKGSIFKRVGYQLIATVAVAVSIGLAVLVLFYSERQQNNILDANEAAMHKVTESVIRSLKSVMIAGYADIAEVYAENLKTVEGVVDFRLLRIDGNEAFRDNLTIAAVNEYRGDDDYDLRDHEEVVNVLPETDPNLQRVLQRQEIVPFYETGALDEQFLTFLAPIKFVQKCDKCHDENQPIRGVLKLTTSLGEVNNDIRNTRTDAITILLMAISIIITIAIMLVRRAVIRPITEVSEAMTAVSEGHLDRIVPVFGNDELAEMAGSFNRMIRELNTTYGDLKSEQNKLATIILTARDGIVATNAEGRVVLVNPAVAGILEKTGEAIVEQGFGALFDNPELMTRWLAQTESNQQVHVIEYRDKVLSVAVTTIYDDDGERMGSTALIRDITNEKRLEETLRKLSQTDGLTGLHNRRYLDETLMHEVDRAQEAELPLSVMMFDIDHFKRFNDSYGHDQGDRVLQAVAAALYEALRTVDIPCRYGGEEFVVILPNTDLEGAEVLAERVRQTIEAMAVDGLKVTVSIGVANFAQLGCSNGDQLVACADRALYRAKGAGRNRVVTATRADVDAQGGS